MRILITRPRDDARRLADLLQARGHQVFCEPLLTIEPEADAAIDLTGVQALVFTSANGVRAFARSSAQRRLPVFSVGEATAAVARDLGFATVTRAGGDVGSLAALIIASLDPNRGPLFHAVGKHAAGDLTGSLAAAGFGVRRVALYEAKAAGALTEKATSLLAGRELDAAVFFSPRTAETFVRLVEGAGLRSACSRMFAYCLSESIAERARELPWAAMHTTERPNQDALLAVLDARAREAGQ